MRFVALAVAALLSLTPPASAKTVKIIEPLPADVIGNVRVESTEVSLNAATRANFDKLEAKAAKKRAQANLPPLADLKPGERPSPEHYATLPITQMFPLVMEDRAREWPLTGQRAVKLQVELDTLKTANAAMALIASSADQLAGTVKVLDANTGALLGEFYVDVVNTKVEPFSIAAQAGSVREQLAREYAKRVMQTLSGSKERPKANGE